MSNLSGLSTAVGANPNPNKSVEVTQPPTDSVSSLCFSPKGNFLVATSWDNQVRCWEILQTGSSVPKAVISHDQPVLCSAWKDDGTAVFSGGCDKQVKMWPLMSGGQPVTVAMHDAPVKELAWVPEMNLLVTGSWDKTLRYWDTRQPNPVHIQQLPERCYALTVRHPLMVVGTADRNLVVFNLQNPQTEFKRITSPLKYQTRCVAAFPDQQGFLVGSIEGRVGVHHMDDSQQSKNFTFKCHREGSDIYSVNSLNFHPVHHTFATSGSDGAFNFWDKDSKQRLKTYLSLVQPNKLTDKDVEYDFYDEVFRHQKETKFLSLSNRLWPDAVSPSLAALSIVMVQYLHMRYVLSPCSSTPAVKFVYSGYEVCYDWSKGAENHNPATKPSIFLHTPQESEVKGKPRIGTSGRK